MAVALYGKAAKLAVAGKSPDELVKEAMALNADESEILDWFSQSDPEIAKLLRTVQKLMARKFKNTSGAATAHV